MRRIMPSIQYALTSTLPIPLMLMHLVSRPKKYSNQRYPPLPSTLSPIAMPKPPIGASHSLQLLPTTSLTSSTIPLGSSRQAKCPA